MIKDKHTQTHNEKNKNRHGQLKPNGGKKSETLGNTEIQFQKTDTRWQKNNKIKINWQKMTKIDKQWQ